MLSIYAIIIGIRKGYKVRKSESQGAVDNGAGFYRNSWS